MMAGKWSQFNSENEGFNLFVSGYKLWKYLQENGYARTKDLAEAFKCSKSEPSRFLTQAYRYGLLKAEYKNDNMKNKYYSLTPEAEQALSIIDEYLLTFERKNNPDFPDLGINVEADNPKLKHLIEHAVPMTRRETKSGVE